MKERFERPGKLSKAFAIVLSIALLLMAFCPVCAEEDGLAFDLVPDGAAEVEIEEIPIEEVGLSPEALMPEEVPMGEAEAYAAPSGEAQENAAAKANAIAIDEAHFPDDNFRAVVADDFDTDGDGCLSKGEIAGATAIDAWGMDIASLAGIEYLTALEALRCPNNKLTSLDLSKNTKLEYLFCCENAIPFIDLSNNPGVVLHLQQDGIIINEKYACFLSVTAWNDPDANLLFDKDVVLYANGSLLYAPGMTLTRKGPSATIGLKEKMDARSFGNTITTHTPEWFKRLFDNRCTFSSSNPKVAVVNGKGRITGKKKGFATITITSASGVSAKCVVNVKKAPSKVKLSHSKLTMEPGASVDISVLLPSGAASRELTWTSSDTEVADCDYSDFRGYYIYAGKPGTATLTVKTFNGKKATCKVKVTGPAPTTLDLRADELRLHIKESFQIVPVVDEGAETKFTYSSNNKKVATVSSKGVVTGKKKGKAVITVKTHNGLKQSITVNISGKLAKFPKKFISGTSGIKVYATASAPYFHAESACSGMKGASLITLETALNGGKTPCPMCLPAAGQKVYAVVGGSYYHTQKAHAGSKAKSNTVSVALALGMAPCPVCEE